MENLINQYAEYLKIERGELPETVAEQLRTLQSFHMFLRLEEIKNIPVE